MNDGSSLIEDSAPAEAPAPAPEPKPGKDPARLGTGSIIKLLVEFSVPAIVMMIFNTLYNLVDTIFLQIAVPNVGAAVTQLAFPMMCILMACSMIAGIGGNALAAIELGRGNREQVERILGNTTTLLIAFGVLSAAAGTLFIDPLLALLGTPAQLWDPTKTFMQIILIGFTLQSLGMGLNNFLRTAGRPNLSLGCSVLGTVACFALNALLVLGMGFGIAGSAFATVLGQGIGMVPVLVYLCAIPSAPFRLHARNLAPVFPMMRRILFLGLASFIMQCGSAVVTLVMNHVINLYAATDPIGVTNAFAVNSIVWKVLGLSYTVVIGVTSGAQPILGFNIGSGKWDRVLETLKWACIFSAALATVCWLLFEIFPALVLSIFNIDPELMDFACLTMRIFAMWLPLVGYQMMGSSYFQSSGQPLKSTILELTRQILFLIPLYLLFPPVAMSVFGVSGLIGVELCVPISDALAFIVTTVFVVKEVRRLRALRDESARQGEGAAPDECPSS
ncbi:MAG: MATE family efflux transporter [Coriobacteriia bacterium]|nr:MATE family efflux transporter [Coriobacteriia bacterium]